MKKSIIIVTTVIFVFMMILIAIKMIGARRYTFDLEDFYQNGFQIENGCISLLSEAEGGDRLNSSRFCLRDGDYIINISYETETDYGFTFYLDNDVMTGIILPSGESVVSQSFSLEWPTDRAYFSFDPPSEGKVRINSIELSSNRLLYTDGIFQILALIILYVVVIYIIVKFEEYDPEKRIIITSIVLMILIVNLPLYINIVVGDGGIRHMASPLAGVIRFGIDTAEQLKRLQGVMYGLLDGQFPVVIAPNYLRENGELQFLYPNVFLYPFAVLRLAGASMPMVFRWFTISCNILTILSMLYSCRLLSDNTKLNIVITALYVFEPHRLRVVLSKGAAMGMGIPYIFVPLAIVGVYLILKQNKQGIWLLSFGVSGVLESHITSVLLLAALLVVVTIICIKELWAERLMGARYILIAAGICLLMNLGFLIIFMYFFVLGLNTDALRWTTLTQNILSPLQMITDMESLFYFCGLIVAFAFAAMSSKRGIEFKFALSLSGFTALLWIMTCNVFPYETIVDVFSPMQAFLDYMQKPHRFYTIMAGAMLLSIHLLADHISFNKRVILSVFIGVTIISAFLKYKHYMDIGWQFRNELSGDINIVTTGDYLPSGTDEEKELSGAGLLSDEENVDSLYYKKRGTTIDYHYRTIKDGIYAEFPLLTYDGYKAVDETGKALDIVKGEDARLTVYLNGDGNEHAVHIEFVVKPVFKILYTFSLAFSILSICLYSGKYIKLNMPSSQDFC